MGVGRGGRQVVQVLHLGAASPGTASAREGMGGLGDFWSIPQTPLWHKQGTPLLTLAWALTPTTTVPPKKLALALGRLAPAPPSLHGTRPISRATGSLQPLRPSTGDKQPFFGEPRELFWPKQHFLLLPHPLLSHPRPQFCLSHL